MEVRLFFFVVVWIVEFFFFRFGIILVVVGYFLWFDCYFGGDVGFENCGVVLFLVVGILNYGGGYCCLVVKLFYFFLNY